MDLFIDFDEDDSVLLPTLESGGLSHHRGLFGLHSRHHQPSRCPDLSYDLSSDPLSSDLFEFGVDLEVPGPHQDNLTTLPDDLDFHWVDIASASTIDHGHEIDRMVTNMEGVDSPSTFEIDSLCNRNHEWKMKSKSNLSVTRPPEHLPLTERPNPALVNPETVNSSVSEVLQPLSTVSATFLELVSSQELLCTQCINKIAFKRPCDLKKHVKNRHSAVPCRHQDCKMTFKSEAAARRHFQTTHSRESSLYCPFHDCKQALNGRGGGFTRRDALNRHMKKLHRSSVHQVTGIPPIGGSQPIQS